MSEKTVEWLAVLIFFITFFALTYAESAWLSKKSGSPAGKSFAFSFATNIFTVVVGFSLWFVVFSILMMFATGGIAGRSGDQVRLYAVVIAITSFLLVPLLVSILVKLLGFRLFKFDTVLTPPLVFSLVTSLIFLLVIMATPVLFLYIAHIAFRS